MHVRTGLLVLLACSALRAQRSCFYDLNFPFASPLLLWTVPVTILIPVLRNYGRFFDDLNFPLLRLIPVLRRLVARSEFTVPCTVL